VISDREIATVRQHFRRLVEAEWHAVSGPNPNTREANRQVEAATKLVAGLAEQGQEVVLAVLLPLLDDQSSHLRYAAAGHLLHHGAAQQAAEVLQALVDDSNNGRVRSLASAALRLWRKGQNPQ
jgi:hypothetical protein